ncbi:MAG: hypothetical protein ACI92A_002406, partial [Candidatus Paceibacteria bacterium]
HALNFAPINLVHKGRIGFHSVACRRLAGIEHVEQGQNQHE